MSQLKRPDDTFGRVLVILAADSMKDAKSPVWLLWRIWEYWRRQGADVDGILHLFRDVYPESLVG